MKLGRINWKQLRGSGCGWMWGWNISSASGIEQDEFLLPGWRCVQVSSWAMWLHLWARTEESAAASHLWVPSAEKTPCGQVLQNRPLAFPALCWEKNENMYSTVARPEGVTPLQLIFILSSQEGCKPCPRGYERSVFDVYLPPDTAKSVKVLVFRKV